VAPAVEPGGRFEEGMVCGVGLKTVEDQLAG
jgi:hypothetical protein